MSAPVSPRISGFANADYFQEKVRRFEEEYTPAETTRLIEELQRFEPTKIVTMDDIATDYPHYSKLLLRNDALGEFATEYVDRLKPFLQAPFPLADGDVAQGPWVGNYKIPLFNRCGITPEFLAGKTVLDIGSNAGFDTFYLSTLGPSQIVGIEPTPLFYYQALFLWAMYDCPNLTFRRMGWQTAKEMNLGPYDVVNCQGIIYHERSPMELVETLFDLLTPGGTLVLETHIILGDEKVARFVEGSMWGDWSWFWVPTLPTVEAMLRARGFEDITLRYAYNVNSDNPDDPEHTVEGEPIGARAILTAVRPAGKVYAPKYGLS